MTNHHLDLGYDRVRAHASSLANARIDAITESRLRRAAEQPESVPIRLGELEREWDIDRAIMIPFAVLAGAALVLGLGRDRRWRFPLIAQTAFLLLHSTIGWCPPAAALRRLGFRTRQEIDSERQTLLKQQHYRAGLVPSGG